MAEFFWGANVGDHEKDVQTGSSDLSTGVQVVIDPAKVPTRKALFILLDSIEQRVMKKDWPPS